MSQSPQSSSPETTAGAVSRTWTPKRLLGMLLPGMAGASAIAVLLMMAALLGVVTLSSIPSVKQFGLKFLVGTEWRPNELPGPPKRDADGRVIEEDGEVVREMVPPEFGALPVIYGTVTSSILALGMAVPLSFGTALVLVRVAPRLRVAAILSFLVEFLAAIPSIAYGAWGLFVLAPILQHHVEPWIVRNFRGVPVLHWMFYQRINVGGEWVEREISTTGRDMLCGSMVLAIMVVPIITSVSRDVLRAVPRHQVEGTLALGATWWQSSVGMLQYARSGLFGAVILGLARAAGETMAVTMVIGNTNQISASPLAPAQTMSSLLANEFAEASTELHRSALLEVALVLLVMSLLLNVVARRLVVGGGSRPSEAS